MDFRAREDDEDVEERVIQTLRAKTSQNSLKLAFLSSSTTKMSPLVVASFRALCLEVLEFFLVALSRAYTVIHATQI